MILLRLVGVFFFSVLLMGCLHREKPPCGPPGSVQTSSEPCYYLLEITKIIDVNSGEVRGRVPQRIVAKNSGESEGFWFFNHGGGFIRRVVSGGNAKYGFFEYQFPIKPFDNTKFSSLPVEIDLHSAPGERSLLVGPPDGIKPQAMTKVDNPCLPPGQTAAKQCYYKLAIVKIDTTNDLVTARVPKSVIEDNAKVLPHLAAEHYSPEEYTFRVRDSKNLAQGSDYDFVSVPGSDVLERCAKSRCEEHFPQ